jgi:hypothetical protein
LNCRRPASCFRLQSRHGVQRVEHLGTHAQCFYLSQRKCLGRHCVHRRNRRTYRPRGPVLRPGLSCVEHAGPNINRQEARCVFRGGWVSLCGGRRQRELECGATMWPTTREAVANMLEGRFWCSAVTIGSAGPAEEQDLFDSLITKASSRRP